ncbi:MAG TPA: hypothetical protein VGN12_22095 [Pirellulales bacterium]|jgi:hypothetical protein
MSEDVSSDANGRLALRFGLFTALFSIFVIAVFLAHVDNTLHYKRLAVSFVEASDGKVRYDHEINSDGSSVKNPNPPGYVWLRSLLGDDYAFEAVDIYLPTGLNDDNFSVLRAFPRLRSLTLMQGGFPDGAASEIACCRRLRRLELLLTPVNDRDIKSLQPLAELEVLRLGSTAVTDEGVSNLSVFKHLEFLSLSHIAVTDRAVSTITMLPLRTLELEGTEITDDSLPEISKIKTLRMLHLGDSKISDRVFDQLSVLPELRYLFLPDTRVTPEGCARVAAWPNLESIQVTAGPIFSDSELANLKLQLAGKRVSVMPRPRSKH